MLDISQSVWHLPTRTMVTIIHVKTNSDMYNGYQHVQQWPSYTSSEPPYTWF